MISKSAHICEGAKLGKDVTVEPFAYIAADVEIGDGCWIGPGAVILDGARLGKNCKVHTAAVVAGLPQDLKFKGEYSTAVVGDNTTIRECATISRGTAAKGVTKVGSNTLIMAYVHVGHDCTVGDNCVLVNRVSLAGEVEVFNHKTNVDIHNRLVAFDIKELGKQLKKLGMLIIQDQIWGRVTQNRSQGRATWYFADEFHLLLKEEQTAAYSA